ncbi:O-methyltransferase [Paenibacillus sp. GSMTC-2017]|uniref:O-methyltransferase n=1 Tax=Paenibacillus sp. GSMTC-2017 TaxID=2794350 RepID=UPI0018D74AE6|nr:O-methyltransferase [Paenibacillus sp. GSMTC-2017]MBH5319182.1 O-methyltransferase [Paenibacillus sp. GSMTC-2017]
MEMTSVSLARQVDFVFRQLEGELTNASAGTVLIHIRNNAVGKFGMKHHPIESKNGKIEHCDKGLTPAQVQAFRQMAIDALKYRKDWTHGEILYDFSVRASTNSWSASVLYESNYNMATWNNKYVPQLRQQQTLRDFQ